MRISIRNKILLAFSIFIVISGLIWLRSYYSQHILHQKLEIIEMKNNLFNTILEARRYEKNFFLSFYRDLGRIHPSTRVEPREGPRQDVDGETRAHSGV